MRYYRISEADLRELLMGAFTYMALESWGVDNWIGWGDAQRNFIEESSAIDFVHYEDMEEIVEAAITTYQPCHCPPPVSNMVDMSFPNDDDLPF